MTVQVSDPSIAGSAVLTDSLMLMLSDLNQAPVLDASGVPYYIAGVGARLESAPDLTNGILVTDFLSRGANGSTFSDANVGALRGIAITAIDKTYGKWQYATATNPTDADWTDIDAAGAVSASSALLLKADATTRVRLKSTLKPHHEGTVAEGFIPLESKLTAGSSSGRGIRPQGRRCGVPTRPTTVAPPRSARPPRTSPRSSKRGCGVRITTT